MPNIAQFLPVNSWFRISLMASTPRIMASIPFSRPKRFKKQNRPANTLAMAKLLLK